MPDGPCMRTGCTRDGDVLRRPIGGEDRLAFCAGHDPLDDPDQSGMWTEADDG